MLSVASFNVHFGGFDRRWVPYDVAEAVKALDADVVILQELVAGAAAAVELPGYTVCFTPLAGVRVHAGGRRTAVRQVPQTGTVIGVGIAHRVPAERLPDAPLGRLPSDPLRRVVQMVRVEGPEAGVVVAGTHMSQLQQGSPLQLARMARALPSADVPAVVGGDMNAWPFVMRATLPAWRPAVRARTFPAGRPLAQIDHLLVTPPVTVVSSEVVSAGRSDHLALRAELTW
ncbi:MAG TPA: endonuclease/exonuclease/phosphatase family protein [Acidimicrobiales bacterium]|nr:endonuclease/exonuclease/phosphatase family protein [Acidimicrobiales bacterium]